MQVKKLLVVACTVFIAGEGMLQPLSLLLVITISGYLLIQQSYKVYEIVQATPHAKKLSCFSYKMSVCLIVRFLRAVSMYAAAAIPSKGLEQDGAVESGLCSGHCSLGLGP